jgi:hypothetical protein
MRSPSRLATRAVRAAIVAVIVAVGVLALVLNLPTRGGRSGASLAATPMPRLYVDRDLGVVERIVRPAEARARRDFENFARAHPGGHDDAAFETFALQHVGPPPTGAAQRREIGELHRIDANRTKAGVTAATWLEDHGKKDVWKLYVKQYKQFAGDAAGKAVKKRYKATYDLANKLVDDGKARFDRPSPYIVDPSLRALNQRKFSGTKKVSYPAKHTLIGFAEAGVLSRAEPHRATEYRWMADEVSFSRLYAGGHYPSDVAAGAYLGTLLAEYERG